MQLKLGRLILFAKDVDRLRRFYEEALGLAVVGAPEPGWVVLGGAGGAELALHAIPPAIASRIEIGAPPVPRADSALKYVFLVGDLEAARARLVAAGAVLLGARDAADPEGNVFQVAIG